MQELTGGTAGKGGDATSSLTRSVNNAQLTIETTARGGDAGHEDSTDGPAIGAGPPAPGAQRHQQRRQRRQPRLCLRRRRRLVLERYARRFRRQSRREDHGATTGNGNSVTVTGMAVGGDGGPGYFNKKGVTYLGNGGTPPRSTGTASGNSDVTVTDSAAGWERLWRNEANGGTATSSAVGQIKASGGANSVNVSATATGGNGGDSGDTSAVGDGGAAKVAKAVGTLTKGSGDVYVTATQTGGDGGNGYAGARGGKCAASWMTNIASGATKGYLSLIQNANGGNGGQSDGGASGGFAGAAHSSLTLKTTAASLYVEANAYGGSGGSGYSGVSREPGAKWPSVTASHPPASI